MKKIETSFEESRQFAQALNLKSKNQWFEWCKSENKPSHIPSAPNLCYENRGWVGWGDFLGTGKEADQYKAKKYLSYEDARIYLATFEFKSENDFLEWCKTDKPSFIPQKARRYYAKRGWVSMGDFLSNGNTYTKEWRSYKDAQKFIKTQNICSQKEYQMWCKTDKRPKNIPTHPVETYPNDWTCWGDYLGYKPKTSHGEKVISFFLQSNNISHKRQHTFKDCRMTNPLPFDAAIFIDDKVVACIEYQGVQHFTPVPYYGGEKALQENQTKDMIKQTYCESNNIPLLVISYKQHNQIENIIKQFLSTVLKKKLNILGREMIEFNPNWLAFEEAKYAIKHLNLTKIKFKKLGVNGRPLGVPSYPNLAYKDKGWISWGDFLGTGRVHSSKAKEIFVSFEECQKWMKDNNIKNGEHWKSVMKQKPPNIPSHPSKIYKSQWKGWKAFLSK